MKLKYFSLMLLISLLVTGCASLPGWVPFVDKSKNKAPVEDLSSVKTQAQVYQAQAQCPVCLISNPRIYSIKRLCPTDILDDDCEKHVDQCPNLSGEQLEKCVEKRVKDWRLSDKGRTHTHTHTHTHAHTHK